MAMFEVTVLVAYEIEADSAEQAENIALMDTEHPVFPVGVGSSVSEKVVSVGRLGDVHV